MTEEFYGRGLSFPLQLGVAGLGESAGAAKVDESIRTILGTGYGERVMRPTFGCNLKALAFAPNNDATANLARYYVMEGLTRWEPRIELVDVTVRNDNLRAALLIEITYRLRSTHDARTLVYPFYLERT
jgi:uncharacterized protein